MCKNNQKNQIWKLFQCDILTIWVLWQWDFLYYSWARFCKLQKGCIRFVAASDKVYQLLAHGRWFSPASSTTKTGRHDIAEILLKVALNTIKPNKTNMFPLDQINKTIAPTIQEYMNEYTLHCTKCKYTFFLYLYTW